MPDTLTCPFCLPAACETAFMECAGFLAVYNLAPILPGHSLVIPKKHITGIMKLTEDELCEYMSFSRKVTAVLSAAFNTEGFDWTLQEKPEAGQTVDHLHLHIIPRFLGDLPQPGDWYPKLQQNNETFLDSMSRPRHTSVEIQLIVKKLMGIVSLNYPENMMR